jgi:hypothetical protein
MASKLSSQLIADPQSRKGTMGDFTHASKVFVDGDMRLSPKVKFLYHVVFEINTNALVNLGFKYKHQNEINLLVKKVDLPRYNIQTEVLNQYNRKKVVQKKIEYNPVQISFHDDNYGVTRQLWENYYSYYFADQTSSKIFGGYDPRNSTKAGNMILTPYGLDNNSTAPFFKKITIYQMTKGDWNSYSLINPLISEWRHDTLSYSQNEAVENNMTILYEAVQYNTGEVSGDPPQGFGSEHYDTVKSPLTLSSGNSSSAATTTSQFSELTQTNRTVLQPVRPPSLTEVLNTGNKTPPTVEVQPVTPAGGVKGTSFPGII